MRVPAQATIRRLQEISSMSLSHLFHHFRGLRLAAWLLTSVVTGASAQTVRLSTSLGDIVLELDAQQIGRASCRERVS
jgi:hypothetical protein